MKKSWLIRGHPIFVLFVVLIFGLAVLIASTTIAIAATTINDQIITLDATARHGPGWSVTQSKNFEFYEVVIGPGPGQKSEMDLLGAGANENTSIKLYAKDDLSLRAPSGLRNNIAVYTAGPWGYHPMAG